MRRAVLVDGYSHIGCDFESHAKDFLENGIKLVVENCKTEEEIIKVCNNADAILTIFGKITRRVIESSPRCKAIVRYAIGTDVIDIEAASERGIPVCNTPDYCIEEVATHTFSLILTLERKIVLYNNSTKSGVWKPHQGYDINRLSSKTIGFIGFGKIARKTAEYAKAFGMEVIAYDPYLPLSFFEKDKVKSVALERLYAQSDIISLHVPHSKDTIHLINKEAISKMKDGVTIVNTSRGSIICEKDLIDGIKSNKIRSVGLDVFENEPIEDKRHPLFNFDNVIVTPHVAYDSSEAMEDMFRKVVISTTSLLDGKIPDNVVNKSLLLG